MRRFFPTEGAEKAEELRLIHLVCLEICKWFSMAGREESREGGGGGRKRERNRENEEGGRKNNSRDWKGEERGGGKREGH